MDIREAREHLQALGFSEHEARAYLALLQRGALTGYQLAKASGIPRPNIYPILDRLEQRGAVASADADGAKKYAALGSSEMLARLRGDVARRLELAQTAMDGIEEQPAGEHVWNIRGRDGLIARAIMLVDHAQRRLLVGIWAPEARELAGAIAGAVDRGVQVTTLCMQGCADECGGCRGEIYRYEPGVDSGNRSLLVISDDERLLAGQLRPDGSAEGALMSMDVLVSVGRQYLRNAIAVAEIVRSLGPELPRILDERARRAVEGTGLATDGRSWFDTIFSVVANARDGGS